MKSSHCSVANPTLTLLSLGVASLVFASSAPAQTNFYEDFESGTLANWTPVVASPLYIATPSNRVPVAGIYSARMTNSACRMFASSLVPGGLGITAESFRFTFWYYDNSGTASRVYNEVRSYVAGFYDPAGAFNQFLAIGKYNSVTMVGEIYNGSKYQARIVNGTPNGWFNLDAPGSPNRSTGWHKFAIERGINTLGQKILTFYVDDKVGRVWTNSNANLAWDSVILGPNIGTTAGDAWFDGLEVVSGQAYITENPASVTNTLGQDATFNVSAIGDADPPTYQWQKNGTNITGETGTSYTVLNCQFTNAGSYSVVVSNLLTVKTSTVAFLQVNPLIKITAHPTNQTANPGSNVTFYVEATGNGTLVYQWRKDGTNLLGANLNFYDIASVVLGDAGSYTCVVTNDLGDPAQTSDSAVLLVNTPPVIASNATLYATVNATFTFTPAVTDDISAQAAPFQAFETNALGSATMFGNPSFSGTTDPYVDNPGRTAVTNIFPSGHGSPQVLSVAWTWTNNSPPAWLRLTTATGAPTFAGNPTIYLTSPLRFDVWCDKDIKVGIGVRESNATGPIGSDAGSGATIEFVGVSAGGTPPAPTNTVIASNWTTVVIGMPDVGVASFNSGNGILNSTTGKGGLEQLTLVPADGLAGAYTMYLDNFVSVPSNAMAFALDSAPAGAVIDPVTGTVTWTPTATGNFNFTVRATDILGLDSTRTFNVVVTPPPPGSITISLIGTGAVLNWAGTYQLQSNTNLITTNWVDVSGVTLSPFTNDVSARQQRYFRLRN